MKKPSLRISAKDAKVIEILGIVTKNKEVLDYSFNSKVINIKSLNTEGNKIIIKLMSIASDYCLS